MKTSVHQNETPFDRMKRQGFEWLEKYPSAPAIINLALSELQSIPKPDIMKKTAEEILSLWDKQKKKDMAELKKQIGINKWYDVTKEKPHPAIDFQRLSYKVMVKTPLGDGTGYYNFIDEDWLVEIDGMISDELQAYKGVTYWKYIEYENKD